MKLKPMTGLSGIAITGHFLARSVVLALKSYLLPVVRDMDVRDIEAIHQRSRRQAKPPSNDWSYFQRLIVPRHCSLGHSRQGRQVDRLQACWETRGLLYRLM